MTSGLPDEAALLRLYRTLSDGEKGGLIIDLVRRAAGERYVGDLPEPGPEWDPGTLDEHVQSLVPVANSTIGWLPDPGAFTSGPLCDPLEILFSVPFDDRRWAEDFAPILYQDRGDAPFYELGGSVEEIVEALTDDLAGVFREWRERLIVRIEEVRRTSG